MLRRLRLVLVFLLASCCCFINGRQSSAPSTFGDDGSAVVDLEALNIDLARRPLDRIPVGTVIGKEAPDGWSHLVMIAIPTFTPEDIRDAPKMATYYAALFKFTLLAKVEAMRTGAKQSYILDKVGRGFATTVKGQEVIVNGKDTLGSDVSWIGRRILDENETILDQDLRQVARTRTMLMFDAKSVVLTDKKHVQRIMRHAILVDPATGKLYTLIWLLTDEYEAAEETLQLIPPGMREERLLSVDRTKFTLGIPSRETFALRRVPPGKSIPFSPELKKAATIKMFEKEQVPDVEAILRAAAVQASR